MKRLLIAAMIAILIGTMQAVKIKSKTAFLPKVPDPNKPCKFRVAELKWWMNFWDNGPSSTWVTGYIDKYIA